MRKLRTTILASVAALIAAGAAQAATAETRRMNVALPDGSIAQIEYTGEVAPRVSVVPARAHTVIAFAPFAGFERIMAEREARHRAIMLQMAALERAAAQAAASEPRQFTLVGDLPAGVSFTYVSSTTDANGCTRTVEYRSRGSGAEPKITRASAGNCDAVRSNPQPLEAGAVNADPAPPLSEQV